MQNDKVLSVARNALSDAPNEKKGFIEQRLLSAFPDLPIVGVDEVGRGCLAGPVVAAAVCIDYEKLHLCTQAELALIRDSKTLSAAQRQRAIDLVYKVAHVHGVGSCTSEEVDKLGILKATFVAMHRALTSFASSQYFLLIDGNMPLDGFMGGQLPVVKGDSRCFAVAAASIIAKVTRDSHMSEIDRLHPGYGFGDNVGYGTKSHMEALHQLGPTPIHRRSFAPVRDLLANIPSQ